MIEIWKDVKGYEGYYQVSDLGNVRSLDRVTIINRKIKGKTLKCGYCNGYPVVTLNKDRKRKTLYVHRLLAETFITNPENKREVNHKNGIKTDNIISNLEWCTSKENSIHAYKLGLANNARGEKSGKTNLTEQQVLEIRKIGYSMSRKDVGKMFNINGQAVGGILRRRTWKHI